MVVCEVSPSNLIKKGTERKGTEEAISHQSSKAISHQSSKAIDERKGTEEAISHQSSKKISPCHRRSEEASSIQARDSGIEGDQEVPEVDGAINKEAAVSETSMRDSSGFQDGFEVPEFNSSCIARGCRGVFGGAV
ncbi:hypothetical protein LIER_41855 [Lithospermum erythrorhizon]|uniref:Uncharacterized protein n=1 Tax=Lithospermum erythrorhizon TaxID=34254 RepID=A0AAV3RLH2_LITER